MKLFSISLIPALLIMFVIGSSAQPVLADSTRPFIVAGALDDALNIFTKSILNEKSLGGQTGGVVDRLLMGNRCENFIKWSERLKQEFPNKDMNRMPNNEQAMYYARLFDDAHFVPYFGKPYDEMDVTELEDIGRNTILMCKKKSPEFRTASKWQDVFLKSFLQTKQVTSDRVPTSHVSLKQKIALIRNARYELGELVKELERMPANAASYDHVVTMQSRVPGLIELIWPSEHAGFTNQFESKRTTLIEPAIMEYVNQAIAIGETLDGLEGLRTFPVRHKSLLSQASANFVAAQMAQLKDQQVAVLGKLMQGEIEHVKAIPTSLVGLKSGGLWYQSFWDKYLKFNDYRDLPTVLTVDKAFWDKRNKAIASSEKELSALINNAKSSKEIRGVINDYLWLNRDNESSVFRKISNLTISTIDRMVKTSTLADKRNLDLMLKNMDGLRESAGWYSTFKTSYSQDMDHALVKELDKYYQTKRSEIISATRAGLVKLISTAQSKYQIDEIWSNYLGGPYDEIHPEMSNFRRIAAERVERLKLKTILAGGLIENNKTANGEPTEEEMYFTVESDFRANMGATDAMKQLPLFKESAAFMEAFSGKQSASIGYFRKEGCENADRSKRFLCKYTLRLSVKTEGGLKDTASFTNALFAIPGNVTAYFTKNESGWKAAVLGDGVAINKPAPDHFREMRDQWDKDTQHYLDCKNPVGFRPMGCL